MNKLSNNRLTDVEDNVVAALTTISLTLVKVSTSQDTSGSIQKIQSCGYFNRKTRSFKDMALRICYELESFLDDDDDHAIMIQDRIFKVDDKDKLIEMIYE